MAAGPVEDCIEQPHRVRAGRRQTTFQRRELWSLEVGQVDAGADVERGNLFVANQIPRLRDTKKADAQALVLGVVGTGIIDRAYRRKEVVTAEGQRAHRIDLIDKHHQPPRRLQKEHLTQKTSEALHNRQPCVCDPEVLCCGSERLVANLSSDVIDDAEVPVFCLRSSCSKSGQINRSAGHAMLIMQPSRHAIAQARLAHLTWCQHVTELTTQQRRW